MMLMETRCGAFVALVLISAMSFVTRKFWHHLVLYHL